MELEEITMKEKICGALQDFSKFKQLKNLFQI